MRGTYDNSYNRNKTRIDGRNQADPAVQAGMRNIHRNTRGEVIGGTTAEGEKIGNKNRNWNNAPGSAGNPSTPGLDRLAAMQPSGKSESLAEQEKRKRKKAGLAGSFGKDAQNLAGRQKLHGEMVKAGTGTKGMVKRAAGLGITRDQYVRAWDKIPEPPVVSAPSSATAGMQAPAAPVIPKTTVAPTLPNSVSSKPSLVAKYIDPRR